jgi:hypothetical protein
MRSHQINDIPFQYWTMPNVESEPAEAWLVVSHSVSNGWKNATAATPAAPASKKAREVLARGTKPEWEGLAYPEPGSDAEGGAAIHCCSASCVGWANLVPQE